MQFQHGALLGYAQGIDALGTLTGTSVTNPSATLKALKNYQAILVVTNASSGGTARMYCAQVADSIASGLQTIGLTGGATVAAASDYDYVVTSTKWSGWQCIVPCNINADDAFFVEAYFNGLVNGNTVNVYGLVINPGIQLRSDGRAFPLGSLSASFTPTSGSPIIAAPASPLRVLLKTFNFQAAAAGGSGCRIVNIGATINGSSQNIAGCGYGTSGGSGTAGGGWGGQSQDWGPLGALCDQNTSITFALTTIGSAPSQDGSGGSLQYDIVI